MTAKEFAKKIIASINPGTADISGIGDGTIKGAISEQNKNLSAYSKYHKITGVTPASKATAKLSDYPEGYTYENTYIVSACVVSQTSKWFLLDNYDGMTFITKEDGVYIKLTNGAFANMECNVILKQF